MSLDLPAASPSPAAPGPEPSGGGRLAARLRGFGPVGILAALVVLLLGSLGGIPALLWVRLSHTPWGELGFTRPRSWPRTVALGIGAGCALKLLMKALVMPLLGANPVNSAYHYLSGNAAALPAMLVTVLVSAGFGEETVFRGFLFERFGRLWGRAPLARFATVLITAALFGLAHWQNQGRDGVVQGVLTGLTFGTTFALSGEIALVMIMHSAFDLTAVWMIYNDLESWFAHLIFR